MSKLTIISTPIGNIGDISKRSIEALKSASIILCEDTRITSKLLKLLDIDFKNKKLLPYYEHNERSKYLKAIELLEMGEDIVLVSDAGTPLLSDPGFLLVREIRNTTSKGFDIEVLPGASSITTALVTSGFPTDKFTFLGFVPKKPNDRKKLIKNMKKSSQYLRSTYIVFETMVRLKSTLEALKKTINGKVKVAMCVELTKKHERVFIGTVDEHLKRIADKSFVLKGEIVLVISLV